MGSMMTKAMLLGAGMFVAAAGFASAGTIEVKVPFAFIVAGQTMPAGEYRIERSGNASVLMIRGDQGTRAQAFVLTVPVDGRSPAGDAALIFRPFETSYELVGVWESPNGGHELPSAAGTSSRVAQTIVFAHRVS